MPEDKSGVGAAVNNTLRQIGAALGVAVMGSVYSVRYRAELGDALAPLPEGLRGEAETSLGATLGALDSALHGGAAGPVAPPTAAIRDEAMGAFVESMQSTVLLAAAVIAVDVVLGLLLLPGRDRTSDHQTDPAA